MHDCQIEHVTNLLARQLHAAATTSRHVCRADALKARCVLAEVRWRWTLKVFCVAACTERNLCADPTLLNPCILRSRRRAGRCEFSTPLLCPPLRSRPHAPSAPPT